MTFVRDPFLARLFLSLCFLNLTASAIASQLVATPTAAALVSTDGFLDEIHINGKEIKARGWAGTVDAANPVIGICLYLDGIEIYNGGVVKQKRPDVVLAKASNGWLESGWQILAPLRIPYPEGIRQVTAIGLLKNGDHFNLRVNESYKALTFVTKDANSTLPASKGSQKFWIAGFLLAVLGLIIACWKLCIRRNAFSCRRELAAIFYTLTLSRLFLLAGVFSTTFASKLFLIYHFGSEIPFWDQWDGEASNLLIPFLEGRFNWVNFFAPHNEHRIALTRLLVLVLFLMNGQWDPLVSMVAQAVLHAGILTFLVAVVRSVLSFKSWSLFAGFTVLLYLLPFSWENTLWGFQSQFYFSLLCGLAGIWLTWKYVELSLGWFLGVLSLFAGLFSMGSGFLAILAVISVGAYRFVVVQPPRLKTFIALAIYLLLLVLGMQLLVHVSRHDFLRAHNFIEFIEFLLLLLSWPTHFSFLGLILYLPTFVIGVIAILRRPPRDHFSWFFATLGLWVILSICALAFGRANSGLASRYTDSLAFGILISFAAALYLETMLGEKFRKLMQAVIAICVAIVFIGIFHITSEELFTEIPRKKSWELYQKKYITDFLSNDNDKIFGTATEPGHVAYHSPNKLAEMLRNPTLRKILPAIVNIGIKPNSIVISDKSFVTNGGVYHTTKPVNYKPFFGSYSGTGDSSTGELLLEYPAILGVDHLSLAVAGYPLQESMQLFVKTGTGKKIPIKVPFNPQETWQEVVFENPGVPFSIVGVDGSPTTWLAVGLPTPIGRLSLWSKWLLSHWWIFGGAGLGFFVYSFLLRGSRNFSL